MMFLIYDNINVLIFRFIAPLYFSNAQVFMSQLAAACNVDPQA